MSKEFLKAAGIRSLKTICQTMLSLITVGQAMTDINWLGIFSVSLVSGIVSLLTSVATGLPETEVNGQIVLERNEEGLPQVKLNLDNVKPGDKLIFIDKTEDEIR